MTNLVVSNVKGGVGKTTTAVYLAAAAAARGYEPVLLIDADRQASSAEWLEERPLESVEIVEAPSERTLTRAMGRHDGLGIVDTPPGDERLQQSAIGSADAVVIPTRAGGVEVSPVLLTLELIPARIQRGIVLAGQGDHARASRETEALAPKVYDEDPTLLYDLSCALAQSAAAAGRDTRLAPAEWARLQTHYADQAMDYLRQAVAKGWANWRHMENDSDIEPLRAREDFKHFLADMKAKAKR